MNLSITFLTSEEQMQASYATLVTDLRLAPCCQTFTYRIIKRFVDLLGSACALILLSPLLGLIVLIVKLSSPGPLFYKWHVVGRGGKRFTGYKFRTMVVNADELKKHLWQYNERNGPTFKLKNDPRVTPVGRILRKFSLDELPQLWSVLKGDMSLVGPRPVFDYEWEHFEDWQRRKLSVTPGMICLWHVRGKPQAFSEWVRLDLEYIDNWSLWLDIKILLKTIPYMVLGRNC
jgi:lipopolysaccharide/colanic/teichoic acid biosynthesis glycosyltransferase